MYRRGGSRTTTAVGHAGYLGSCAVRIGPSCSRGRVAVHAHTEDGRVGYLYQKTTDEQTEVAVEPDIDSETCRTFTRCMLRPLLVPACRYATVSPHCIATNTRGTGMYSGGSTVRAPLLTKYARSPTYPHFCGKRN